jgi:hypothetical protein
MTSALPRWPSVDVRCGMTLALREAMDSDFVARWKRSNRQARKTGRVDRAQTIRHVGVDIDHKFRPLSSDRELAAIA